MLRYHTAFCLLLGTGFALPPIAGSAEQPDLDPQAVAILKSTVGSIADAKTYSFQVRVSRDRQATNNQLVTYITLQRVTVSRPDKVRIDIDGEHHDLQFFFDAGKAACLTLNTSCTIR